MTPLQKAEYRDWVARSRIAVADARKATARAAVDAKPKRPGKKKRRTPAPLPPRSEAASEARPRTPAELALAEKLLPHLCRDSVVDLHRHAVGVARMILQGGPSRLRGDV